MSDFLETLQNITICNINIYQHYPFPVFFPLAPHSKVNISYNHCHNTTNNTTATASGDRGSSTRSGRGEYTVYFNLANWPLLLALLLLPRNISLTRPQATYASYLIRAPCNRRVLEKVNSYWQMGLVWEWLIRQVSVTGNNNNVLPSPFSPIYSQTSGDIYPVLTLLCLAPLVIFRKQTTGMTTRKLCLQSGILW